MCASIRYKDVRVKKTKSLNLCAFPTIVFSLSLRKRIQKIPCAHAKANDRVRFLRVPVI